MTNRLKRLIPPIAVFALLVLMWLYPLLKYEWRTRGWEKHIKTHQDPVQLQSWATDLLATYETNHPAWGLLTNKPPLGIPVTQYGPRIMIQTGTSNEPAHIHLIWGGGHLHGWGLGVGNTNFVAAGGQIWKPGIYFFRSN